MPLAPRSTELSRDLDDQGHEDDRHLIVPPRASVVVSKARLARNWPTRSGRRASGAGADDQVGQDDE